MTAPSQPSALAPQKALEIARALEKSGLPIERIAEMTGLSISDIMNL
jgi:hypothetical protein